MPEDSTATQGSVSSTGLLEQASIWREYADKNGAPAEASDAAGGGLVDERAHLMDYVLKLHIITGPNGMCMCGEDGITCSERLRQISHEIGDALLGAHMAAGAGAVKMTRATEPRRSHTAEVSDRRRQKL